MTNRWLDRLYYVVLALIVALCVILFVYVVHTVKTTMTQTRSVEHICVPYDGQLENADLVETQALCEGVTEKSAFSVSHQHPFLLADDQTYVCYPVDIAIFMAKNALLPSNKRIICEINR
jgi:hypothetical protein